MFLIVFVTSLLTLIYGLPSMRDSLTNSVHVYEADDALITCMVRDIGNSTVLWKKEDTERHSTRVLTAGDNRVTADTRYEVLHDADESSDSHSDGDVWVLVIKDAKPTDSGVYVCEVNSSPIIRSFHKLNVISKSMLPPMSTTTITTTQEDRREFSSKNHNYTDCCMTRNVSSACLGYCNIQSILEGTTGKDPEQCELDFPAIVYCMADGRNHIPCCIQERVPDICQDVCRGEYTAITDNIKTHFSCSSYTEQTLACIVEGIELLPSIPENVEVEALTGTSLRVEWSLPISNSNTVKEYILNVTTLKCFDDRILDSEVILNKSDDLLNRTVIVKVPGYENTTILSDLTPFTMYEIKVTARNSHGTSLPSYAVRSLTLTSDKLPLSRNSTSVPPLPDIKACCRKKGITHRNCIDKLCEPTLAATAQITDLMICAPWAVDTFTCLTNGLDHTDCCRARGLPEICQHLCTGNISVIDFNYFRCLRYMGTYSNCLLQGYGVLPGPPTKVHVTNIETEFAIIHWSPPTTLGDTVLNYNIYIRNPEDENDEYKTTYKVYSPHLIDNLESETDYEVYVEAVNVYGIGMPSSRIMFRTASKIAEDKLEEEEEDIRIYNVTECCINAQLNNACLPLCTYDAKMSDIKALAGECGVEFSKILRCGAGGRNHAPCCNRRGVPGSCLSLCNGVIIDSLLATATTCVPYIGNIVQCFEEGSGMLPGPISALHAVVVDAHSIMLEWNPPENSTTVLDYVVHYQKADNTSMHETLLKLDNQFNTTSTTATITGLEENQTYQIFVVARNEHGLSLPSSMIVVNLIESDHNKWVNGVTSPPHSLAVASHSATWVTVAWQPPEFSHPSEIITYKLFHKSTADQQFQINNTSATAYMITNLKPNTQYIVYVQAVTDKGISMSSETLIAWTDPAYPAFVEPPTVHPINLVIEGSSMTILCIAMGTPMPTISLYISGRLVRQETVRHMVTVIHNVTKDMDQISCYADNGYGTPMQASRKITISYGPRIQASGITMATPGDSVTLQCKIEAQPEPKMIFWRSHEDRTPVTQGGKYDIITKTVKDEENKFLMQLTIKQITDMDAGEYYCHAENAFGSATQPVSVRIRNLATVNNITQCCIEQNVTYPCMDACFFQLDMDAVIDKPECIQDFDKLMKCAADGSDHRSCCAHLNVPRRCLDWCRGEPILNNKLCVLAHTKQIMSCFHEGRENLPGPPQNVKIEFIDSHSVNIIWNPPVKNPHTVELYRVYWRPIDDSNKQKYRGDTPETRFKITDLKAGETYEVVVKAGNSKGTSSLTETLKFTMGDITSAANQNSESYVGMTAVISALVIVAVIIIGGVWFIRTKQLLKIKTSSEIAFENPSYLREVNMDNMQMPTNQTEHTHNTNIAGKGAAVSTVSGGPRWKSENFHVPARLGQDSTGFKRLKP